MFLELVCKRLFPRKKISPPSIFAGGMGSRFNREWQVTDFPDPDSPTKPNTSPLEMEKLTPSTAFTIPSRV